jgi:amino acid adenylation domain-containing protein
MSPVLIHRLVSRSAELHPERPAIVDGDRVVTYGALDLWSSQVAQALVRHGVRRGDRVGILMDKSADAVAAIYGVLKAGACYVPCDASAPAARIMTIVRDSGMRVVCVSAGRTALLAEAGSDLPIRHLLVLDGGDATEAAALAAGSGITLTTPDRIAALPGRPPAVPAAESDLAYVLYTSGSTGTPKGVMLTHRNCLSFVRWVVDELGLSCADRLSSHAPFHFDLSTLDLFAAAAAGASTWLVPKSASLFPVRLASFIRESRITVWYSVPSVLSMLVQRGGLRQGDLPDVRAVLFAGEVFPARFLRSLMRLVPHARYGNLYGPTETNVCTAYWVPGPPEDDQDIPIGSPISGVEAFLVRDAPGSPPVGELYVRGPTVARGYWGDPVRTRQRFVPDPRADVAGGVAYRTGDLVELLDTGEYRFLGRRDNQIKTRGHRVELGEVEAALRRHPGVVEAAAVGVPHELATNLIKAYVVADPGTEKARLREHCERLLPRHMVPDVLVIRSEMPKTSTGKIDRQALSGGTETDLPGREVT